MFIGTHSSGPLDLLDYYLPGRDVTIYMNNGERFNVQQDTIKGRSGFYIIKNKDGNNFEEFAYDSEALYHLRDTTWTVRCKDGNEAYGRAHMPRVMKLRRS